MRQAITYCRGISEELFIKISFFRAIFISELNICYHLVVQKRFFPFHKFIQQFQIREKGAPLFIAIYFRFSKSLFIYPAHGREASVDLPFRRIALPCKQTVPPALRPGKKYLIQPLPGQSIVNIFTVNILISNNRITGSHIQSPPICL